MKNYNSDIAYEYIRKRIIGEEFAPRLPLMTEALATAIGISRTPVRDALRKLEADGLVSIRPRLGACVKRMDMKEFYEICEVRIALEGHAAGLASKNRTDAELEEIQYALNAMEAIAKKIEGETDEHSLPDLIREDVRFHVAIIKAAKNDLLKSEIIRLHIVNRITSETMVPRDVRMARDTLAPKKSRDERRKAVHGHHAKIFAAIERGSAAAAKRAMEFHLEEAIRSLRNMISHAKLTLREPSNDEMSYSA